MMTQEVERQNVSPLRPHIGAMLLMAAGRYPDLYLTLLEIVQNAIDSDANRITILLDRKRRNLIVTDNGEGASLEKFTGALSSVALTMKQANKLGQFGIGLISPLGKCVLFTFTSTPKGGDGTYRQWTFVSDEIAEMRHEASVPMEVIPDIKYGRVDKVLTLPAETGSGSRKVSQVTWRTRVEVRQYTSDRHVSRIGSVDECLRGIFARFGTAMRAKNVKIDIRFVNADGSEDNRKNVTAPEYTGQPLEIDNRTVNGVHVKTQIFLAQRDTRGRGKGEVVVGQLGNNFRFPLKQFIREHGSFLDDTVKQGLVSGLFEGDILASRVRLHENRQSFIVDESLEAMCDAINAWFAEEGIFHYTAAQEAQQNERYQKLGAQALDAVKKVLDDPRYEALKGLLEEDGSRDSESVGGRVSDFLETVVDTEPVVESTGNGEPPDGVSNDPENPDRPKLRRPKLTSRGPKGTSVNLARIKRFALNFCYTELPGRDELWLLEEGTWTLVFNTRHPLWVSCDEYKSDRRVKQLMEIVAISVLNWVVTPSHFQDAARDLIDQIIIGQVQLLLASESFKR